MPHRQIREAFTEDFSKDISAGSTQPNATETKEIDMSVSGRTDDVHIVWPGADGAVGVQLRRNEGEKLFPRNKEDQFSATPIASSATLPLRVEIEEGETLVAEYVNRDTTNDKFLAVFLGVTEL